MIIRLAEKNDLVSINEIYNQAVDTRCSTGDISHIIYEMRVQWFEDHDPKKYPVLVADTGNKVIGWISLSPYRKGREGLKYTVEVSYYIHNEYQRKGYGSQLVKSCILLAQELNFKTIIAILFSSNEGSIRLLEKNNFEKWGILPDVIEIDNKVYSHFYYGLKLTKSSLK